MSTECSNSGDGGVSDMKPKEKIKQKIDKKYAIKTRTGLQTK